MFALDTNSIIYFFKGMGRVGERLLATPPHRIAIPAVVLYELEVGIAKSSFPKKRRSQLEELLSVVNILPFRAEEARRAARIRAGLEALGKPIGPLDTLIAGTASSHGATLITRNTKEFGRIKNLKVENWY
jgi:tRNA(fMet)-specific endonuclease VapC